MTDLNPQLAKLNQIGQSIWYDDLSREVLDSGELESLVKAGVTGLTSNPTIFKKAIADTSHYDQDISRLYAELGDRDQVCEELMIGDVARAADLLRGVYDQTNALDGYASIEVSPFLADKTEETVEAARRIWGKLARPNIMIKVPATPEGMPAISTLISEGINVNVTLIFSEEVYRDVMEAYLSGLEKRLKAGDDISKVASVASFFVSRVDAQTEKDFAALLSAGKVSADQQAEFLGQIGIANSRLAYAAYKQVRDSERFQKLKAAGAMVQRPLWASTGTKNPEFSPVLYVEQLAGPESVNTLPPNTLEAVMQGADLESRIESNLEQATQVVSDVNSFGIDFSQLLVGLQKAGVESFAVSYQELLDSLEQKQSALNN